MEIAKFMICAGIVSLAALSFESGDQLSSACSTDAAYKIPNSSKRIVLHLRNIHPFLAEYERKLVFCGGDKEVVKRELEMDSGGYTRINIYRVSTRLYFVEGALSQDKYYLNVNEGTIEEASVFERVRKQARFLGSLDWDESNVWRFMPAPERIAIPGLGR